MLTGVSGRFLAAKKSYNKGAEALTGCFRVVSNCLELLNTQATLRYFGNFSVSNSLQYSVAQVDDALSRPYRPELFIADPSEFAKAAVDFVADLQDGRLNDPEGFDRIVYTAVTAFSLSYDVWKPKSRKTPGTFFEILIGSAARIAFPSYVLTKHIPIRDLPIKDEAVPGILADLMDGDDDGAIQACDPSTTLSALALIL